jgi:hypothetical protein
MALRDRETPMLRAVNRRCPAVIPTRSASEGAERCALAGASGYHGTPKRQPFSNSAKPFSRRPRGWLPGGKSSFQGTQVHRFDQEVVETGVHGARLIQIAAVSGHGDKHELTGRVKLPELLRDMVAVDSG